MLLLLRRQPVRETLVQLARGLRCCMSGFNSVNCVNASDAFGTPTLLTFFIVSTAWSAASFGLLRVGGEMPLAIGSALILPTTLLAFVRPMPLPYSWAAAPLNLCDSDLGIATWLSLALIVFHSASRAGTLAGDNERIQWRLIRGGSPAESSGSSSGGVAAVIDESPALALTGPSLHL